MTRPLWLDPEEQTYPQIERDSRFDVAIVGGGLSGLGAGYALRESGLRVALIEAETVGSGASGRNGGFVLAGPALAYPAVVSELGSDAAQQIWRFTEDNNRMLANIVEREGISCGYLRRGSMSLAASEDELPVLRTSYEALRRLNISVCLVGQSELPRPFDRFYFGGLYYGRNGEMNSGAFVRGVAASIASSVTIFERSRVLSLVHQGTWKVQLRAGTIEAERVILATNGYTCRLWEGLNISPVRGQVLATVPLGEVVVPFPMYAKHGYQYWRQTPDGRVVVGGWRDLDLAGEVGDDDVLNGTVQSALLKFVRDLSPAARPDVDHQWSGTMGFTPDHLPLVGPVPGESGLYLAAGYSGHGVSMAFHCGASLAEHFDRVGAVVPAAFSPARFARKPAGL